MHRLGSQWTRNWPWIAGSCHFAGRKKPGKGRRRMAELEGNCIVLRQSQHWTRSPVSVLIRYCLRCSVPSRRGHCSHGQLAVPAATHPISPIDLPSTEMGPSRQHLPHVTQPARAASAATHRQDCQGGETHPVIYVFRTYVLRCLRKCSTPASANAFPL